MQRKQSSAREQKRRGKALAALTRLADTIQARNQGLTAVAVEKLVDRFTREVIQEMVAEGKISYKQH